MLRYMGAIDEHTLVVTTVHDCQVRRVLRREGGERVGGTCARACVSGFGCDVRGMLRGL